METKRIQIQGLQRNKALNEYPDGAMQEIINMRFRDGAWRPIGQKEKIANALSGIYDKIWLHSGDNLRNFIGYNRATGELSLIDIETGSGTLIETYYEKPEIDIKFIKRMAIVIGEKTMVYLWKDDQYQNIDLVTSPFVYVNESGSKVEDTGQSTTAEGLLGQYRAKVYEMSQDGYIVGSVAFRFAWKLYDGSYIKHTIPQVNISSHQDYNVHRTGVVGDDPFEFDAIKGYKLRAAYPTLGVYDGLNSDVVLSLCIFMSKPEERYKIDEEAITDEVLHANLPKNVNDKTLSQMNIPLNDDYDNLADAVTWYLVHEIPLEELQNLSANYEQEIDLKGFMQDYAVRERLPVDSFSHHKIGGMVGFTYNDRLILGDTRITLGDVRIGIVNPFGYGTYTLYGQRYGYICAVLKTDIGERRVYTFHQFSIFTQSGKYYIFVAGNFVTMSMFANYNVIGYQDARATKIEIYIDDLAGSHILFASKKLTKSKYDNYAYYKNEDYGPISFESLSVVGDGFTIDPLNTIEDENRVQISELRNPIVFPARTSYQVGTGRVMGFGANTEPLSTGQFGQYPLLVFTTKGLYALEQGQGDVLFAAISPVSGDVALNQDQIISVGMGVTFTTNRGIYIASGKQVQPLSDVIEGAPLLDFQDNKHFQKFINDPQLVELLPHISIIDVIDYIPGSKFGFDKTNNELIISNENLDYSYVFNFESSSWHKVTDTFSLFINDYPELLGLNESGLFNLSVENSVTAVSVLFVTQPQPLNLADIYKKMERTVLRCNVVTQLATYLTFAVFASNDLRTWQFITGGQRGDDIRNILLTRSHGSAKYYIFLVSGQLVLVKSDVKVSNSIQSIDVSISPRLEKKLRQ